MRVEVTEACKVYMGGVPHDLVVGQTVKGTAAMYLLENGAPVRALDEEPADIPPPDPDAVPEGSAEKVAEWVGDDPAKARKALDAELAGKARKQLIAKLEKIATATEAAAGDGAPVLDGELATQPPQQSGSAAGKEPA